MHKQSKIAESKGPPEFSSLHQWVDSAMLPVKFMLQPLVRNSSLLTSNEDIRLNEALKRMKGHTLDIGCRSNRLIRRYRKLGGRGLGVDVVDWGGQDLLVENSASLPFEDNTFDTVTLIACINHIPNREDVLLEIRRILKPDGQLLISNLTPLVSFLWHKFAIWDRGEKNRGMATGEVYGLRSEEIRCLIETAGFFIAEKSTFSWGLNQFYRCKCR